MVLQLVHATDDCVEARYGDALLFRYVYRPDVPPSESPRPYLHPVHTLRGNLVTDFRPEDHPWQHGISMTCAHLASEQQEVQNFWGGSTYIRDRGYVQLDNNGRIEHLGWDELHCDGESARLVERLRWVTRDDRAWLAERREVGVSTVDPISGYWAMSFHIALRNIAGQRLVFGSPTTAGRPLAGYGGLYWRGPKWYAGGRILAAAGLEGPAVMGKRASWLAYTGGDAGHGQSTLLFIDHPDNPRYPTQWFVRNEAYGCASFAFTFDAEYAIQPGEELALRYCIVIADGDWPRERMEEMIRANKDDAR